MSKLKRPKNYRWINRRCCANCRYWIGGTAADWECARDPDNIAGDWNSLEPEYHTCDRWAKEPSKAADV